MDIIMIHISVNVFNLFKNSCDNIQHFSIFIFSNVESNYFFYCFFFYVKAIFNYFKERKKFFIVYKMYINAFSKEPWSTLKYFYCFFYLFFKHCEYMYTLIIAVIIRHWKFDLNLILIWFENMIFILFKRLVFILLKFTYETICL